MAVRVPLMETGRLMARVDELRARKGPPPWSDALVLTDDIQAFIICHPPGQPNDTHYHLHDEWWVVLQGEIDWYIEDEPKPIRGRAGRLRVRAEEPVASSRAGGRRAQHPRRDQCAGRVPPLRPSRLSAPAVAAASGRAG